MKKVFYLTRRGVKEVFYLTHTRPGQKETFHATHTRQGEKEVFNTYSPGVKKRYFTSHTQRVENEVFYSTHTRRGEKEVFYLTYTRWGEKRGVLRNSITHVITVNFCALIRARVFMCMFLFKPAARTTALNV